MFSILRFYNIWVHIINQNIDAELHNKTSKLVNYRKQILSFL